MKQLVIVGLGLMGGSLAADASAHGLNVKGVSAAWHSRQHALAQGWVQTATETVPATFEPDTWVVLCGPLSVNRQWLSELADRVMGQERVWVTDVGSCKRAINTLAAECLPGRFVGGHPLAGKAQGGIDHAQPGLYRGRPWVLCPNLGVPAEALIDLHRWIDITGAQRFTMTPDVHDHMMAWVSHFPQVYSVLLANLLQQHGPTEPLVHGPALAEHLRLATSPLAIWQDILTENADYLAEVLRCFGDACYRLEAQITCHNNPASWADWFDQANTLARQIRCSK